MLGSFVSDSVGPHGLQPARLLRPWGVSGKDTGVGCHALLQGTFLTQGSNLHFLYLLPWQVDSLPLSHLGSPMLIVKCIKWLLRTRHSSKHFVDYKLALAVYLYKD